MMLMSHRVFRQRTRQAARAGGARARQQMLAGMLARADGLDMTIVRLGACRSLTSALR